MNKRRIRPSFGITATLAIILGTAMTATNNSWAARIECPNEPPSGSSNVCIGTSSADNMIGTSKNDFIEGNTGSDVIHGGLGDDDIVHGAFGSQGDPSGPDGSKDDIHCGKGYDVARISITVDGDTADADCETIIAS